MHYDDAEIVSRWVRPKDFQYKFVQVPAGLVKKEGSSQVVADVVLATKSSMINSVNGAQQNRENIVMRMKKWSVCMYLVWDLAGPINRLFLLAVVILKWLEGSFDNIFGLFNLVLSEAPTVSSLICNRRGIKYLTLWRSILVQAGSLDKDNCLVYHISSLKILKIHTIILF